MERRLVTIRRTHFESVLRLGAEWLRVLDQRLKARRWCNCANDLQLPAKRIEHELQRGESLLPVDYGPLLHQADWLQHLLQNNGS
jgi:hypothetical protein